MKRVSKGAGRGLTANGKKLCTRWTCPANRVYGRTISKYRWALMPRLWGVCAMLRVNTSLLGASVWLYCHWWWPKASWVSKPGYRATIESSYRGRLLASNHMTRWVGQFPHELSTLNVNDLISLMSFRQYSLLLAESSYFIESRRYSGIIYENSSITEHSIQVFWNWRCFITWQHLLGTSRAQKNTITNFIK
jgi:hypothetical protein